MRTLTGGLSSWRHFLLLLLKFGTIGLPVKAPFILIFLFFKVSQQIAQLEDVLREVDALENSIQLHLKQGDLSCSRPFK